MEQFLSSLIAGASGSEMIWRCYGLPAGPEFPFFERLRPCGLHKDNKTSAPNTRCFRTAQHALCFLIGQLRADTRWQLWTGCLWVTATSITHSGAANVRWAGRAPRAIYFFRWGYSLVQESASRKDRTLFWARRRCLSRRERDEDDHCVMSSCVTVAVCSRSLSVSWIYLMYSAQVLLTCPFISYGKNLKRMNTALVSVKRQCTC